MSKKLRSIVYEHSSGHLVATAATEEQLGRIKDILCEPRTEACNAAGRQLYEPEQLLADAKVGDLCKTDIDEWIQIDDTSEPPSPILYHFDRPFNGNIIHTEPLAPEGTDKWAWQMMLLGKKVCQKHNSYFPNKRYYAIKDGNDYCAFYENNGNEVNITNTRRTYDEFIEYCKFTPQYNWQLYTEPQTEPCEICGGIGMISCEACNATGRAPIEPEPAKEPEIVAHKQHANCLLCRKEIEGLLDGHATVSIKRYSISSLYESTYSHYCGKCFLKLGFDATERELRNRQQPIAEPEPEPQPAYAVGDWVQCGIMQAEIIELREILNGRQIYHMKEADGTEYDADSSAFDRKLSSSEVRVKITLEGTVRKSQLVGCFVLDTPLPGNDVHTIRFADIDPATAALVRDLLEKQKEEKNV
jgi:hypothetical protein